MLKDIKSSVIAIVVLTAVFGFGYPALMTGIGQAADGNLTDKRATDEIPSGRTDD